MYRFVILIAAFIYIGSCTPKLSGKFLKTATSITTATPPNDPCRQKSNYIPDATHPEHTPIRQVRVNIHYMRNAEGEGNFQEKEGCEWTKVVLDASNKRLSSNKKMTLPEGNDTPVVPTRYRYQLTACADDPTDDGIYFHNDDELYFILERGKDRNNYSRAVFEKYGMQKDTVLNVFVMENHLDSIKSPTYKATTNGISFGSWVKCSKWYTNNYDTVWVDGKPTLPRKWIAPKQLDHEIGHSLGLRHTWRGNDGCDDTPNHANCWQPKGKDPCVLASNNVMDYNARRNAWSPCQLGIVHYNFANHNSQRRLLIPTWCTLNAKPIVINEPVLWNSCKDLESHIVVERGGELIIQCRVSLPKDAIIDVKPGGKLIIDSGRIHNDCGSQWKGIKVWSEGGEKGEVIFQNGGTVENVEYPIELSAS